MTDVVPASRALVVQKATPLRKSLARLDRAARARLVVAGEDVESVVVDAADRLEARARAKVQDLLHTHAYAVLGVVAGFGVVVGLLSGRSRTKSSSQMSATEAPASLTPRKAPMKNQVLSNLPASALLEMLGLQTRRSTTSRVLTYVGVAAAGVVVGGAVALLFTPKSGRELRQNIRGKAKEIKEVADDGVNAAIEAAQRQAHEFNSNSDDIPTI
jgi:ElaB/YqjD/DUF883 family membrane-anchored ribosome-binding protein